MTRVMTSLTLTARPTLARASLLFVCSIAGCGGGSQAPLGGDGTDSTTTRDGTSGSEGSNGTTAPGSVSTTDGDLTTADDDTGPPTEPPSQWVSVATGDAHTCAVAADGTLWCWGSTTQGVLGNPEVFGGESRKPVRVGKRTDWEHVWAGSYHNCARASDRVWCWGMNSDGQLAIGDVVPPLEHSPVMSLVPASADEIAMALRHGCVVDADTLVCWGRTPKPGGVPSPAIPTPTIVPFDMAILSHRTSPAHTCVLTENLEIWCWGRGDSGQLGNGSLESLEWPTRTFTDFEIGELAAVNPATCVRDLSGGTYCVGRNHRGQFGNGMIDDEPVVDPQASPALDGLQLVGGPGSHACGLAIDGTLSCWGFNQQGQVGDGSTELRATPVEIGDAQQWMAVATGMVHTCAIDIDGRLWCWGSNSEGQVGDGSDDMLVPLPSQVGS